MQFRCDALVIEDREIEVPGRPLGEPAVQTDSGQQSPLGFPHTESGPAVFEFGLHVAVHPRAQARAQIPGIEVAAVTGPVIPLDHAQQFGLEVLVRSFADHGSSRTIALASINAAAHAQFTDSQNSPAFGAEATSGRCEAVPAMLSLSSSTLNGRP